MIISKTLWTKATQSWKSKCMYVVRFVRCICMVPRMQNNNINQSWKIYIYFPIFGLFYSVQCVQHSSAIYAFTHRKHLNGWLWKEALRNVVLNLTWMFGEVILSATVSVRLSSVCTYHRHRKRYLNRHSTFGMRLFIVHVSFSHFCCAPSDSMNQRQA